MIKKYIYSCILAVLAIKSCFVLMDFGFGQNDFILSNALVSWKNEKIVYDIYRTGIDNYRYEFKAVDDLGTTKLFDYYLNDATYKAMKFKSKVISDTIIISNNFPTNVITTKTTKGTVIIFMQE